MSTIKPIPSSDLDALVTLQANAYPGMKVNTVAERERLREQWSSLGTDPSVAPYGLYQGETLLGSMLLHDFTMTVFEFQLPVGGVGAIAVDLTHKKEHIARDLVLAYLRHYRARGTSLTALYPFRPDFYRAMGFGYGTKLQAYRLRPGAFPVRRTALPVRLLTADDQPHVAACYARSALRTHGMFAHSDRAVHRMFNAPDVRVVGVESEGELRGYLAFRFQSAREDNFLLNDLVVRELIYESPQVLLALLDFLRRQADQVRYVVHYTQDDAFHYLVTDPRTGSDHLLPSVYHESDVQGLGLMYRVIDVPRFFTQLQAHHFGVETCQIRCVTADSFLPENAGAVEVHFEGGLPRVVPTGTAPDAVEMRLDIAEFTSLVLGCVSVRSLWEYGLVTVADARAVDQLTRLFAVERKPVCLTAF
jgi:predicted acetyltransferase